MTYVVVLHQKIFPHQLQELEKAINDYPKLPLTIVHMNTFMAADGDLITFELAEDAMHYANRQLKSLPLGKYGFSVIRL